MKRIILLGLIFLLISCGVLPPYKSDKITNTNIHDLAYISIAQEATNNDDIDFSILRIDGELTQNLFIMMGQGRTISAYVAPGNHTLSVNYEINRLRSSHTLHFTAEAGVKYTIHAVQVGYGVRYYIRDHNEK